MTPVPHEQQSGGLVQFREKVLQRGDFPGIPQEQPHWPTRGVRVDQGLKHGQGFPGTGENPSVR
jgi:hypothetical protein